MVASRAELSPAQIAAYNEQGYLLVPGLLFALFPGQSDT